MAAGRGGQLFIVSGPSGSGKTSVVQHLLRTLPDMMFSVSYTTRAPRVGEQDGREYRFLRREEFEAMLARGEFLEHAEVFGCLYGTHASLLREAEQRGKDVVLDIDVSGAGQVKARRPEAVAVLLVPPSWKALQERLRARGLDTPEMVRRRLEHARQEIEQYEIYDYLVVNRVLEETCEQVRAIVLAERNRRAGLSPDSAEARQSERHAAAARKEATQEQVSAILERFEAQTS